MNIPSYMGGVNLWGSPSERKYPPQAMDDGLLEVIILKNSAEMAISKGSKGNITPTRLCQARDLKIILHQGDPIPIQVDGEAWMQQPCVLSVTHKGRAQMLSRDKGFQKMLLKWPAAKPGSSSQSNDILSKFDVAVTSLLGIADKVAQSVESVAAALQKLLQAVRDNRDTIFDKKGCRKPAFSRSKVVLYVHNAVVLTETLQLQFNLARQRPPFLVTPTDVEGLGAAALGPLAKALDLASAACEHQTRRMMAFVDEGAIKGIRKGSVMSRFKRRLSSLSAKRLSAAEDSSRAASPLASPQGSPRTSPRASPSSGRVRDDASSCSQSAAIFRLPPPSLPCLGRVICCSCQGTPRLLFGNSRAVMRRTHVRTRARTYAAPVLAGRLTHWPRATALPLLLSRWCQLPSWTRCARQAAMVKGPAGSGSAARRRTSRNWTAAGSSVGRGLTPRLEAKGHHRGPGPLTCCPGCGPTRWESWRPPSKRKE